MLGEGLVLAIAGSVAGALAAVLYTTAVLRALATVWRGAVGAVEFQFSAEPRTLAIGVVSGVLIALVAMWFASRKQLRHSARELLAAAGALEPRRANPGRPGWVGRALLPLCLAGAVALLVFGRGSPGAFFGAGALFLIAGLQFASARLSRAAAGDKTLDDLPQLGLRNAARRRGRSLATMIVLAAGVFMVVAVDSFRHRPQQAGAQRNSGTGGFALIGESALPVYEDLNTQKGRETYALGEEAMREVGIVPMRVREGDDASCLNLNRALQPRLLGVKPDELQARKAFRFAGQAPDAAAGTNWDYLKTRTGDGAIPAITDANTLQWALQKKLGDTLTYRDERGEPFEVKIVATLASSILQGNVIIAEEHLIAKFPSQAGYRFFLIDAPAGKVALVRAALSRALEDRGFELTPADQRLAEFLAVENTYLSIFQVLGGLGLLLGSAGLAIVVARNVLERRGEFGLLEAVGFHSRQLHRLVFAEHRWLIAGGLLIGTASALLAVWPGIRERASGFPYSEMALLLAALALGCVFWTWLATRLALRGSRIQALRTE
ncbi:MAG: hypothetical protein M3463_09235 [Verrucomicrobiota bacterium]|nr:hypothetical protein [Verrucomicrobiota bacterium]